MSKTAMTPSGHQGERVRASDGALVADVHRVASEEAVIAEIEADIAEDRDQDVVAIQVSGLDEFAELLLRLCYPGADESWVKTAAAEVLAEVVEEIAAKGDRFEHWVGLSEEELAEERASYLSSLEHYAG